MNDTKTNYFDEGAAGWDAQPHRVELAKAVGETILRQVQPTPDMDVLDYGCGTGLLGLFLLPHVRSVTGADNSPGMLQVLEEKIQTGGFQHMRAMKLDLEHDRTPDARYRLIVANMVLHHVKQTEMLLAAFHQMLLPGGALAIADLDAEPGIFHTAETMESVHHHGFDRRAFIDGLGRFGFVKMRETTAHVIRKPIANGNLRDFPVFLITGCRA